VNSNLDFNSDGLREQPLSADEKQLLSEYFQLEGKRQYDNYRTMLTLRDGRAPADLFQFMNLPMETAKELSDKQLSLELSQRDHWISLMESIHEQFYEEKPALPSIELWSLIGIEKHAIVKLETGQDEFRKILNYSQQRQMQLLTRLGEHRAQEFVDHQDLFYKLLDIDGIRKELILFS